MQERRLKDLFDNIPSMDELYSLGVEGLRADIILVDAEKDKKLSMLKQLIVALVKGLSSNPASMIKKVAGLVRFLSLEQSILFIFPQNCRLVYLSFKLFLGSLYNGSLVQIAW